MKQVPLLKTFVLFALGIILAEYAGMTLFNFNSIIIGLLIVFCIAIIILKKYLNTTIISVILATIFILSGMENRILQDERYKTNHFSKYQITKNSFIAGEIRSKKKTSSGTSFVIDVKSIISDYKQNKASGNLLIYSKFNFDSCNITKGDIVKIPASFHRIDKNKNPLAFNPRQYYHYQNIHFLTFSKRNIKIIKKSTPNRISQFFISSNTFIKSKIRYLIKNNTSSGIAISILLGDKQNLDKEILNSFSATGTRHILTVSGMHVGIVALILNFIFSFIKIQNKLISGIKILVILSGIWFYAFLTGAGVAVLRAAFMISLIMIGINLRRYINIFNILFGSALIIILINPLQLFQLGFILSYAAMLSILLFYRPIYSFLKPVFKPINYLWQLISLSIAAQILIFPLSLYYFHSAPILFFLSAIIATPMAFGTIFLGFSAVIMDLAFHYPAKIIAGILEKFISSCLHFIEYIQSISIDISQYVYIDQKTLVIISMMIIILFYVAKKNKIIKPVVIMVSMLILTGYQWYRYTSNKMENEIVIYSIPGSILSDIFLSGKTYVYSNKKPDNRKIRNIACKYRNFKGSTSEYNLPEIYTGKFLKKTKNVIKADNKTIVFLNSEHDYLPCKNSKIDYLVIDGNLKLNVDSLLINYNVSKIILTNRIQYKNRKFWKKTAKINDKEIWDIKEKGAFVDKLKNS